MLDALDGVARLAVGFMYFTGLRPGEARAARWEDYDPAKNCAGESEHVALRTYLPGKTPEQISFCSGGGHAC